MAAAPAPSASRYLGKKLFHNSSPAPSRKTASDITATLRSRARARRKFPARRWWLSVDGCPVPLIVVRVERRGERCSRPFGSEAADGECERLARIRQSAGLRVVFVAGGRRRRSLSLA